jgi:hypothetical protein
MAFFGQDFPIVYCHFSREEDAKNLYMLNILKKKEYMQLFLHTCTEYISPHNYPEFAAKMEFILSRKGNWVEDSFFGIYSMCERGMEDAHNFVPY